MMKQLKKLEKQFFGYNNKKKIEKVGMREIVRFEGALNCITWTIKE